MYSVPQTTQVNYVGSHAVSSSPKRQTEQFSVKNRRTYSFSPQTQESTSCRFRLGCGSSSALISGPPHIYVRTRAVLGSETYGNRSGILTSSWTQALFNLLLIKCGKKRAVTYTTNHARLFKVWVSPNEEGTLLVVIGPTATKVE